MRSVAIARNPSPVNCRFQSKVRATSIMLPLSVRGATSSPSTKRVFPSKSKALNELEPILPEQTDGWKISNSPSTRPMRSKSPSTTNKLAPNIPFPLVCYGSISAILSMLCEKQRCRKKERAGVGLLLVQSDKIPILVDPTQGIMLNRG